MDARLRNQLEVHQARVRGVNAEIATLTAAALAARRANQRAEAISCMKQIRLRQAKRHKYEQMAHFCQQTLDRVNDLESVHETMAALGDVRRQYGQIKMDELYERFGAAVQDVTEARTRARMRKNETRTRARPFTQNRGTTPRPTCTTCSSRTAGWARMTWTRRR